MVRRSYQPAIPKRTMAEHDRSAFPQRSGRRGDRDRRARVHVRRRQAAVRSSACLPRHGRRQRDHLPVLLDALPARPDARPARGAAGGLRPDRAGLSGRRASRGVVAQHHRRRRRDRRTDRGADAGAKRLPRHPAGTGRAAGGNRRRHPALAQRHPHPDRARAWSSGCGRTSSRPRRWRSGPRSGGSLARIPLGARAEQRYGAPYWSIHRGDLQAALLEAVRANPDIVLRLGTRVEDFVVHANGISVACRHGAAPPTSTASR